MQELFKIGDLIVANKYAMSITSQLIVSNKENQQTLFHDYSLLGVIIGTYTDMCHIYLVTENKYTYMFYGDILHAKINGSGYEQSIS